MRFLFKSTSVRALFYFAASLFALGSASIAQRPAQPGDFDFYLLTLSWSPQFCLGHPANPECVRPEKGFVVHGLWPEWNSGKWPAVCSNAPQTVDTGDLADLLSADMVAHEWSTHGTCSNLSAEAYFSLMRSADQAITIPPSLATATEQLTMPPSQLKAAFVAANQSLDAADIAIGCTNGNLVDVEICLDKNGAPTHCPVIKDCKAAKITISPILQ